MELMSVPEAARESGLSEKSIRRAIYDEELPACKPGASWVVDADDLAAWLEAMEEEELDD